MKKYLKKLLLPLKEYSEGEINIEKVRKSLLIINQYFFNSYEGIGKTYIEEWDLETNYFSEFHKLWEAKAEEILAPEINEVKCQQAACVLHKIRSDFKDVPFLRPINLHGLEPDKIALVRFLTANQDFRGSRNTEEFFDLFNSNPAVFDLTRIIKSPASFLNDIGITDLSQNDKREKFAKTAALFLKENDIDAYSIAQHFNNNVKEIKNAITNTVGMGYGNKKTDMLLRDMYVWGVWSDLKNISQLNVASDINTIKVALRTGILTTKLSPLISSFLDIFCHQYATIDIWVSNAWRRVWEIWGEENPETVPFGPSFMDYLLYRIIGKEFCQDKLFEFRGEGCDHTFFWHTTRNKYCQTCFDLFRNNLVSFEENDNQHFARCQKFPEHYYEVNNRRKKKCKICEDTKINNADVIRSYLPCTKSEGYIYITKNKYVSGVDACLPNITICPFSNVCQSMSDDFKIFNPPKSISILGRTGWESAKTNIENGGGGLMA